MFVLLLLPDIYSAFALYWRCNILLHYDLPEYMYWTHCFRWSYLFSPHFHYGVFGHVELHIIRLFWYKIFTERLLSLIIKAMRNIILFIHARVSCIHTLWKTDMLWVLCSDNCVIHELYCILCVSLTMFYAGLMIISSIIITYTAFYHVQNRVEISHIIFIMDTDNVMESINDTMTLMTSLLLLLCGDVHPNPGPHQNIYNDFSLCHLNIRSLSQDKLRCIKTSLAPSYDIIAVTETFLSANHRDDDYTLPGFHSILRLDRVGGIGGGVAVFVSRALRVERRTDLEIPGIELMWVEVRLHNNKFLLGVVYRPPSSPVSFWTDLQASYDLASGASNGKIIMMGDLNADPSTNHGRKLNSFCTSNLLTLHIHDPTRITERTSTCLDQIITNIPNFVHSTSVLPPVADNDHCTVTAHLLFRHKKNSSFERFIWLYAKADFDEFRETLDAVNWDPCFDTDDINEMSKLWTSTFLNIARRCIPNRTITVRQDDAPWYSCSLRAKKRKVERIHKKAKDCKTSNKTYFWHYFRQLRNEYISDLRAAEENYFNRQFDSVNCSKKRGKGWWKTVNYFVHGGQT